MSPSTNIFTEQLHLKILRDEHPWIQLCVVRVSPGLGATIDELLTEIESILGDQLPPAFFRITEKETGHPRSRRVEIFIEPINDIQAQKNALASVVSVATTESVKVCCECGTRLRAFNDTLGKELAGQGLDCGHLEFGDIFCPECHQGDLADIAAACKKKHDDEFGDDVADETGTSDCGVFRDIVEIEPVDGNRDGDYLDDDQDDDIYDEIDDDEIFPDPADEAVSREVIIQLFSTADVDAFDNLYKDSPGDAGRRSKSIIRRLRAANPKKRLALIPDNWDGYCDSLAVNFPNFGEVVEFIRNHLALSSVGDQALRLPPMLLIGPPGVGKSEFALTIASDLNTKLEIIDMSSAQTGTSLSGSEIYWSNSAPGVLFNTLTAGDVANPIFMLDEIDKAGGDPRYDPLSTLHQLLEPRQAAAFHDLSVPEVAINASHVIWIATANELGAISQPIRDRFTVFTASEPTRAQMTEIIHIQYARFVNHHPSGCFFDEKISDEALIALAGFHPRKVRKVLEGAFGFAARMRSPTLRAEHIQAGGPEEIEKNGFGFLAKIKK
ncbi:MAG: AAA family ATPase [Methylococcales bacterium]|nr:AAA family ATPase [Methylococcales bacterium]